MAILDPNSEMDSDVRQLLGLMQDLSEQLNQNRTLSVALYGQAGEIKVRVLQLSTHLKSSCDLPPFTLRTRPFTPRQASFYDGESKG